MTTFFTLVCRSETSRKIIDSQISNQYSSISFLISFCRTIFIPSITQHIKLNIFDSSTNPFPRNLCQKIQLFFFCRILIPIRIPRIRIFNLQVFFSFIFKIKKKVKSITAEKKENCQQKKTHPQASTNENETKKRQKTIRRTRVKWFNDSHAIHSNIKRHNNRQKILSHLVH